jgi:hypothetical protein
MADMQTFEHRVAAEMLRRAGPSLPVDDLAVYTVVARRTAGSSSWRLPSPFIATRFVVAGAIVALFGGFLLSGVLTQQLSEERVPAAVTGSPVPTTTPDLLPGVGLITEEVEPGVYRVLSDGVREFGHSTRSRNMSLTFRADGSLWTASLGLLSRLGSDETVRAPAPGAFGRGELVAGPDGMPWAAWAGGCENASAPSISSFDGTAWTLRSEGMEAPASGSDPRWPPDAMVELAIGRDGVAWAVGEDCGDEAQNDDDAHTRLLRLGPDGWSVYRIGDGLPMLECGGSCSGGWNIDIMPDGTVWLGVPQGGLLRFDGSAWEVVRPLGGDEDHGVISLASNQDGVLWAEIQTEDAVPWYESRLGEDRLLARFDGRTWEVFPYVSDGDDAGPGPGSIQAVGPDGTVWLTDANTPQDRGARILDDPELQGYRWTPFPVSFDGERWRRYPQVLVDWASDPLAELERWQGTRESTLAVDQIAVGPDGAVWLAVGVGNSDGYRAGLYVITREAVAASE